MWGWVGFGGCSWCVVGGDGDGGMGGVYVCWGVFIGSFIIVFSDVFYVSYGGV